MTNHTPSPVEDTRDRTLLFRFLLILAASLFSAFGFSSLLGREGQSQALALAINLAGAAGIGLATGYLSRLLLATRWAILKLLINVGCLLTGLLMFGWMTNWNGGIGPLDFYRTSVDWNGLGIIGMSLLGVILSSSAYRKPLRTTVRQPLLDTIPAGSDLESNNIRAASMTVNARRKVRPVVKKKVGKTRKTRRIQTPLPARQLKPRATKQKVVKKPAKAVIRKGRSKKIVLARAEEHRCPYCLELVKPNDPRGVVECDVCHTLHHADCWAITGTCQVPHYNH